MNYSKELLVRCSKISDIMTNAKKKNDIISVTAKNYLVQQYRENKYQRRQEYTSKYIEKGLKHEEDAITLLSRHTKKYLTKNEYRLNNDFITGEPDAFIGTIDKGDKIVICPNDRINIQEGFDTKCSYDVFTFPYGDILNKKYYWQAMGYMALTGADKWTIAYCLVNSGIDTIDREKKSVYFKMDCPDDIDNDYIEKLKEIEKNMIFDMAKFQRDYPYYDLEITDWDYDIPVKERVKLYEVHRNEQEIDAIYEQVAKGRWWLKKEMGE